MTKATNQKQRQLVTIVVASLIAIALLCYMVTFQVRFTEVAVVTTFGNPTRAVYEPGLYWKWPFPVQNVRKFDKRIQEFESRLEQIFTDDDKNVILATYIGWRVQNPIIFMSSVGDVETLEKSLEGLIRSYVNGIVSRHPFSHLISEVKENIQFEEIEASVQRLINEGDPQTSQKDIHGQLVSRGVKDIYGVEIVIFGIKRLELPPKTTPEVFARMQEERKRIAEQYRSRGKSKAKEILTQAESQRDTLLADARAEAKVKRGEGDAKAAEHYKAFAKHRELAIWLRKIEALKKLLTERTTLLLDTRTQPFDLLKGEMEDFAEDRAAAEDKSKITPPGTQPSDGQKPQDKIGEEKGPGRQDGAQTEGEKTDSGQNGETEKRPPPDGPDKTDSGQNGETEKQPPVDDQKNESDQSHDPR